MVIFTKKKTGYVDLSKKLSRHEEKIENLKPLANQTESSNLQNSNNSTGFFGSFFGGSAQASDFQESTSQEDKREKLKKRLIEMTNRLEEHEKEIYQLKQRLEIIERKQKLGY